MSLDTTDRSPWQLKSQSLKFGTTPLVMGIVNSTPDSFSDGGQYYDSQQAIRHALQMVDAGAHIIDVGGESTRPYSTPVDADEERRRVTPVIRAITDVSSVPISIDTSKASVAAAALEAGAEIINDVTGLEGDPDMIRVAIEYQAGICAMHMQGTPQTMQDAPTYNNVVEEIFDYLQQRKKHLLDSNIALEKICLDPGIGFGKTHDHNLELLANCERFLDLESPILIGHSRKGFIGKLLDDKETNRDSGTLAISLVLAQKRMHIIRVHEVEETVKALKVFSGVGGTA